MNKSIPKPKNWQDFEELCLMIWREEWNCPEIKRNGRSGQVQNGVDIFGIPNGQTGYYGIQCKLILDNRSISESEIDEIIVGAKSFNPPLLSLYIVTSAEKDSSIEAYVRKINMEFIAIGNFKVNIFCWGELEHLIHKNENIFNWYFNLSKTKQPYAEVFFENEQKEIILTPVYIKTIVKYNNSNRTNDLLKTNQISPKWSTLDDNVIRPLPFIFNINEIFYNLGTVEFRLHLVNDSNLALEDYQIHFNITKNFAAIDVSRKKTSYLDVKNYAYDTSINTEGIGKILPFESILLPQMETCFDAICIKPFISSVDLYLNWSIHSKTFYNFGSLKILIRPEFIEVVDNSSMPFGFDYDPKIIISNYYTTDYDEYCENRKISI